MKEKEKLRKSKFLRNKKSFIFLVIMCLGVGFAFLSTQLNITGNTSVSGNKWSVYFDNVQVTEGSVDATVVPTTSGTTTTSVEYTVNLDKPGDFYEFTVDAVNAGTIDAMIDSVTMTTLDTDVAKYLNYTATYLDGSALQQNNVLKATKTATYKVRVEYKKNIEATDLSEEDIDLTLTFGVNYVQSNIKPIESKFAKLVRSSALSDSSINFGAISSESNGRGLYVMNNTTEDDYPIYYYRGAVTNNNAKFAGFCWKIVRTTETGGTKLLYNGTPNASGECTNTTGNATQLSSTSRFNTNYNSPAYNGYMYGTVYEFHSGSTSTSHKYGETVEYDSTNRIYTLSNTHDGVDSTHHYTCLTSSTSCAEVNYVYYLTGSTAYYITLTGGKNLDDAFTEMNTNTNNSTIKTAIDTWFNGTFKKYFTDNSKDYNDYLEDTVWCNDRSMNTLGSNTALTNNGWIPNGGSTSNYLYYSSYGRLKLGTPSLACSNKNDSFTVEESSIGNGALTYPVGLLTADEMNLAGGQLSVVASQNKDYYLYTAQEWWSLTPYYFSLGDPNKFYVAYAGGMYNNNVYNSNGVRPSISLKPGVKVAEGGDGSSATPYEFVVE